MSIEADSISPNSARAAALEALEEASAVTAFVQSITDLSTGNGISLTAEQTIGFYHSLQHIINRIGAAGELVSQFEITEGA